MESHLPQPMKHKNKYQSQQISKKYKKKHGQIIVRSPKDEYEYEYKNDYEEKMRMSMDFKYPLNQFTDPNKYYSWIIIEGNYKKIAHLGIPKDISRLQSFATNKLHSNHRLSSVLKQPTALDIDDAISKILTEFADIDETAKVKKTNIDHCIMMAFSGHGDKNGDWCLSKNNCLSLNYILESIAMYQDNYDQNVNLMILSTACCSGNWCYDLERIKKKKNNINCGYDIGCINDITIIAASGKNAIEWEIQRNPNDGSRFFRFMLGVGKYENHSGLEMCNICKNVMNKKYKINEHKEYHHNQYCWRYKEYNITVHCNGYNEIYEWNEEKKEFEIKSSYHVNDNKKHKKKNGGIHNLHNMKLK